MEDGFLAEQLERMRRLNERMSQAHDRVERNCELIARERDRLHGSPLDTVRDLRPYDTQPYPPRESKSTAARGARAQRHPRPERPSTTSHRPVRKRRR